MLFRRLDHDDDEEEEDRAAGRPSSKIFFIFLFLFLFIRLINAIYVYFFSVYIVWLIESSQDTQKKRVKLYDEGFLRATITTTILNTLNRIIIVVVLIIIITKDY